jgi:lysophospholipid acyltransferase (LPLAT)-like uncharacterized protein
VSAAATPTVSSETSPPEQPYTAWQKVQVWLISTFGALILRLIGPTLRFAVSFEDGGPTSLEARPVILSFWHCCIFPATYIWRDLQIRVMTSRSFDGEWIASIISKFGFVPVRGSSSRGGVRALLNLRKDIAQGWTVAFTIDGPRGPRFVAKPGPVVLARATEEPMVAFHIAVARAWTLNTWDRCIIPKPFSTALMRVSRKIMVPPNADDTQRDHFLGELQASLDRVREFAETNVKNVGTGEFPIFFRKI